MFLIPCIISFQVIAATATLAFTSVLAYHDPDLNYHLSQVQKINNCGDNGYSYPAPAVQLTTAGVKVAAPSYQYSNAGYSAGVAYQAPTITYAAQPATYQTSSLHSGSNYATASNEFHGYSTTAGLSAVAGARRTVTPLATYAQAPIIAKVTAAPLIAKFAISPARTTYISQNSVSQQASSGSAAKASLNSYSSVQTGGPVVSQVYAAPSSGYAVSPALRSQQPQVFAPAQYSAYVAPVVAQYKQAVSAPAPAAQLAPAVTQYATSVSNSASGSQYFRPAQYSAPAVAQYSSVAQYSAPSAASVTHYSAPSVAQYAVAPAVAQVAHVAPAIQYSAPVYTQHSAPVVTQYATSGGNAQHATSSANVVHYSSSGANAAHYSSSGANVAHYATSGAQQYVTAPVAQVAVAAPAKIATPVAVKNVHTEFLENYVSV